MFNLPNAITLSRIAVTPAVLFLYDLTWKLPAEGASIHVARYVGFLLYLMAVFSDLVDGHLARRRGITSRFGKLMDPLADKFLALSLMVLFSVRGVLPIWYTLLFLWREVGITGLRGVAASEGLVIAASDSAKRKTVYLNIALGFFFVPEHILILPMWKLAWIFLLVALGYSLLSAWQYIAGLYRSVKSRA